MDDDLTKSLSQMDKVYTFLEGMRVVTLKQVCDLLSVKKAGKKGTLIEHIFFTMGHMGAGSEYP